MINVSDSLLGGIGFGFAGLLGVWIAQYLGRNDASLEDGPAQIPLSPWLVVVFTAAIGVSLTAHHLSPMQLGATGFFLIALVAAATSDCAFGLVPDMFTLLPLAIFLCASLLQHHYEPLLSAMVVALPFALLACFSHGRGMGWGDVKMAAFAGAVLPPNAILFASFLAVGATFAISRISRPSSGTGVAFVPYFASAIGMVLLLGSGF